MEAVVTYPFTDKASGEVRYAGERIELAEPRFAELLRKGFVVRADAEEPVSEVEEQEEADAEEPVSEVEEQEKELTAAQLRAKIEAKGGFAPKRATKAQLSDILETL